MVATYIKSVLGCIFLLDLICIVLPSGKTGKSVLSAFKLVTLVVLFTPIVMIGKQLNFTYEKESSAIDDTYLLRTEELQAERFVMDNFLLSCRAESSPTDIRLVFSEKPSEESGIADAIEILLGKEVVIDYEIDG